MGWYLRKSLRLGPLLRLNLSKSGLGLSFGVKGARIGTGPRGNYVHLGRYGLYCRQQLPSAPSPSVPLTVSPETAPPTPEVTSADVSGLKDSTAEGLLNEIAEKHAKIALSNWALALWGIVLTLLFLGGLTLLTGTLLVFLAIISWWVFREIDKSRKTVIIRYNLEDPSQQNYADLNRSIASLAESGGLWQITAQGAVSDRKYHAGASSLIDRKGVAIGCSPPAYLQTNVAVWRLSLKGHTLYFWPDRVLVYQGSRIGSVPYEGITIEISATEFVENERVPSDARVVRTTWKYVNRDGGPDRRFSYNPTLPVALYSEVKIKSVYGMRYVLQVSNAQRAQQFADAVRRYAHKLLRTDIQAPEDHQLPSQPSVLPLLLQTSSGQASDTQAKDLPAIHPSLVAPEISFDGGFLTLGPLNFCGPGIASPNGAFVLGWQDAIYASESGEVRPFRPGHVVLVKNAHIIWERDLQRPNNGKVADTGHVVINDWCLNDRLCGIFYAFKPSGIVLIRHEVGANLDRCGLDSSGAFAWCTTLLSDSITDSRKLFVFSLSPPKLLFKVDMPIWPVKELRTGQDIIKIGTSEMSYEYSSTGELLNRTAVESAHQQFIIREGNPYQMFDLAQEQLEAHPGEQIPQEVKDLVSSLLNRVVDIGNSPAQLKAKACRMLGELSLASGDKQNALLQFQKALLYDPHVGVKQQATRLQQELD